MCHSHSYSALGLAPFLDPVATRTGCRALLADCEFDGGHMTTCVTAKSSTGGRLLGEIAPGLIHQTGCNGAGAAASLAWGEETAGLAREVLARS